MHHYIQNDKNNQKFRNLFITWKKKLDTYALLATLKCYHRVLRITATLSAELQRQDLTIVDVRDQLKKAIKRLAAISITKKLPDTEDQETQSPPDETVDEDSEQNEVEEQDLPFRVKWRNNELYVLPESTKGTIRERVNDLQHGTTSDEPLRQEFRVKNYTNGVAKVKKIKMDLIPKISAAVQQRFESLQTGKFDSMSLILDHHRWDFTKKDFGRKEIKELAEHFRTPLSESRPAFILASALKEWAYIKEEVHSKYMHQASALTIWSNLICQEDSSSRSSSSQSSYRNILLLIKLLLSLPFSSATVERGFSTLGRFLTDQRRCLCKDRLNQLMLICCNVKALEEINPKYKEYLLDKAAEIYMNEDEPIKRRKRRYNKHRPNKISRLSGDTSSVSRAGNLFFPSSQSADDDLVVLSRNENETFIISDSEDNEPLETIEARIEDDTDDNEGDTDDNELPEVVQDSANDSSDTSGKSQGNL